MNINLIKADDVLTLRRDILYPNKNLSELKLPEDDFGMHYGLFVNDRLISVVSLFISGNSAQFRKFATLTSFQGKGYGSALLNHLIQEAAKQGCETIWCNARLSAADFYLRFGFTKTEETFTKDEVDFVIMRKSLRT
ncbi:GNAT family N-acetyltransferase [Solitalea sp. MAHUQ-68]|uniref:GNAT family N-acetyltransferase n=1 Tax=Solitalea agri TaxID=2953739 RepID=A0A9X2F0X1_9SPHI|nr:GNAT family N-acetyltransferase [Solitalea agri]MCO4292080.1 GNAT family N-acetyltransferase [Solitalea agri]